MLEKFLKLTPKLSKQFPIFDTSGETMCNNKPGSLNFPTLRRAYFQAFTIFSVPKITSGNTPDTRKPPLAKQESQKTQFFELVR